MEPVHGAPGIVPIRRPVEVRGTDVGGDALLEAMQLVRPDEMHLAAQCGLIAFRPQIVSHRRDRRRKFVGIVPDGDAIGITACKHGGARRRAEREVCVSVVEDCASIRERAQVRRFDERMPVTRQCLRRELVRHDQQNIWTA